MKSRMDKYKGMNDSIDTNNEGERTSRVSRNQELYKEVSYAELDNFDLNSNVLFLEQSKKIFKENLIFIRFCFGKSF